MNVAVKAPPPKKKIKLEAFLTSKEEFQEAEKTKKENISNVSDRSSYKTGHVFLLEVCKVNILQIGENT